MNFVIFATNTDSFVMNTKTGEYMFNDTHELMINALLSPTSATELEVKVLVLFLIYTGRTKNYNCFLYLKLNRVENETWDENLQKYKKRF
jgi:hypothetical protein